MPRAIFRNGLIYPIGPLPADWQDGMEVEVEKHPSSPAIENDIQAKDAWMDEVEKCAAELDPEDDLRLQRALDEERRLAKELAQLGKY